MFYIDVSAAVHARAGLGRYSAKLAQAIATARPRQTAIFHNLGADGNLPPELAHLPRRTVGYGYKPWRMMVAMGQIAHLPFNRLVPNAQLFHSTEHLLLPLRRIPTVLTVHDLIYDLFPQYHKSLNYWYLHTMMPLFCRRATAVVAVSQATKRDIVEQYHINPDKIHVIYEAAADNFAPATAAQIAAVRQKYQLPDQFLIHLSTIEPRKNLPRLVDALQRVRRDMPDLQLILVGAKGWLYDDFFAKIEAENLQNIVRALGWVPDEDLPAVLGAASLAVQPSLYEGFGLPLLEHMAAGQVVAASHASSFPEVGGTAVAYFNPHDTDNMAAIIRRLLTHQPEYKARREAGFAQAQKFSWQRAARETLALYDHLLEKQLT